MDFQNFYYLTLLLLSISGLMLIDRRYKLAFFFDKSSTLITVILGIIFFLVWDLLGIWLGIFFIGSDKYLTGMNILPEVPIEEIFFLFLLCYVTLLTWQGAKKWNT